MTNQESFEKRAREIVYRLANIANRQDVNELREGQLRDILALANEAHAAGRREGREEIQDYYMAKQSEWDTAARERGRREALAEVMPTLTFYSDKTNWHDGDNTTPIEHDFGERARALMEKLK